MANAICALDHIVRCRREGGGNIGQRGKHQRVTVVSEAFRRYAVHAVAKGRGPHLEDQSHTTFIALKTGRQNCTLYKVH